MRSKPAVLFIMIFISSLMSAQEDADQQGSLQREVINANPQLALSSPDYQVTAGDIYTLAYTIGSAPVTYRIAVDSGYMVRISNLGIINAEGKTYRQLKAEAEAIVTRNYPLSGAQLVLSQPGIFRVFVNGEVTAAAEVSVWALTRLSSLASYVTSYASLRNVLVKSGNGQVKNYDLFKAEREGDLSQNPYLRPDDAITFNRLDRQVTISGEVERPGDYQLLDGENLKDLLETYACGFTPLADKTRIELTRFVDSGSVSGDKTLLGEEAILNNYQLKNYDAVIIPTIMDLLPVFFVEGAVEIGMSEEGTPTTSNRLVVSFHKGDYYASVIRPHRSDWFSAVSDTQNAYIIRAGEQIRIPLNRMLYDADFHEEVHIEENDTLVIPFRQYFVNVAGAVKMPGLYPYIPDREWDYYIGLAGGFLPGQNNFEAITIRDVSGKRMKKTVVTTFLTIRVLTDR